MVSHQRFVIERVDGHVGMWRLIFVICPGVWVAAASHWLGLLPAHHATKQPWWMYVLIGASLSAALIDALASLARWVR